MCKDFLRANVSAIIYLMNYEQYGRSTASAQYFLQLAGYLGIPVISWNADNSGLERTASQSTMQVQLAPSIEHQAAAMLSILERYKWHQFSIVTSQIAGHDDFVQAVRERVNDMQVNNRHFLLFTCGRYIYFRGIHLHIIFTGALQVHHPECGHNDSAR